MEKPEQGKETPPEEGKEEKVTIKVQGQDKEVTQAELVELAQKGDDYTAKTQKLAEDRKKMEEETQQKAEELAEQYLAKVEEEKPPVVDDTLTEDQQRIAKLEKDIATMKGSTEETRVAQYELQYEKNLAVCKTKFPNMDEKVVLATLSANPKLDMEQLAKESHESKEKERDEWVKQYLDSKTKQPKEMGGGQTPPQQPDKEYTAKDLKTGSVKRAAADFIRQRDE